MPAETLDHQFVTYDSIREIDRSDWSSLELPSAFLSHGWLATVETMAVKPPKFWYLLMYQGPTLVGAVAGEMVTSDRRRGSFNRAVLGRAAKPASRLGLGFEPTLVCSAFDGYGSTLLIGKSVEHAERQEITRRLLNAWRDFARDRRLPLGFCGLTDEEHELVETLKSSGFHRSSQLPIARLAIRWDSFSEYLQSVRTTSASVAKDVRRERNRLCKSGIEIRTFVPEPPDEPRLLELAQANYRKYGDGRFPYEGPYFSTLARALGDDLVLYGAWKGKQLVAFSLMLRNQDRAWGTYFGCDYEASGRDHTYFNIVFNRPIEDAIESGLSYLYFGRGLHDLKCRRGCESIPSYLFYRSRNRYVNLLFGPAFRLRSSYFEFKARRTSRTFQRHRLRQQ
jgi:predicted N-acyltransferase